MFDLGWPEMLVIAIVLIVVVGPKDLPKMLRTFGRTTSSLRRMAGDFRKQFDEALKEAELDEIKSTLDSARKLNPASDIKKALNPMERAAAEVRAGLDGMMKPQPPATVPSADAPARATEPAKTGATAMPGETQAPSTPAPPAATPAAHAPAPAPMTPRTSVSAAPAPAKPARTRAAAATPASAKRGQTSAARSEGAAPAAKPAAKPASKSATKAPSASGAPVRKPAPRKPGGAAS